MSLEMRERLWNAAMKLTKSEWAIDRLAGKQLLETLLKY